MAPIDLFTLSYLCSSLAITGRCVRLSFCFVVSNKLRSLYKTNHSLCKSSKLCRIAWAKNERRTKLSVIECKYYKTYADTFLLKSGRVHALPEVNDSSVDAGSKKLSNPRAQSEVWKLRQIFTFTPAFPATETNLRPIESIDLSFVAKYGGGMWISELCGKRWCSQCPPSTAPWFPVSHPTQLRRVCTPVCIQFLYVLRRGYQ